MVSQKELILFSKTIKKLTRKEKRMLLKSYLEKTETLYPLGKGEYSSHPKCDKKVKIS